MTHVPNRGVELRSLVLRPAQYLAARAMVVAVLVLGVTLASRSARARDEALPPGGAPAAKQGAARAERLALQGQTLFNAGLFEQAAAKFQDAYVTDPRPALLYNIGLCYRRMGGLKNLEKALFHYEAFMHNTRELALRGKLERRIERLKREIRRLRADNNRPPPLYKRWWFWTAIGVAVAGAATGAVIMLQPEHQQPVPSNLEPAFFHLP